MVLIKGRTNTDFWRLYDSERPPLNPDSFAKPALITNTDGANAHYQDGVVSFNSDGFLIDDKTGTSNYNTVNRDGDDYASWTFRKAPKFFDCVTYTGNNSVPTTVPHGLGIEPGMIIIKSTSDPGDWYVYHKGFTFPSWCALNSTDAQGTSKGAGLTAPPTAESFTVSNGSGVVGAEQDYVAYLFAHDDSDESMIKCGSYTGTGAAGNEIDLGFEPQWVMVKGATTSDNWTMYDTMRGIVTGDNGYRCGQTSQMQKAVTTIQLM